ncbi:MAG: PfkB family carbohydrate kinase [Candidatus Krumholzibacteria bacterium]|nr:PfkB family carbohydrate kinase [Candidatus Krumholzibacteria bacterium]MDH4337059.1 PfkB family carbohydrate kinase [Candidatus Krumholzibacteria bacterium]MDH5268596.1 PfkB family carbohydrate kinase [Candidatus Krumholzibacteria bacterium]
MQEQKKEPLLIVGSVAFDSIETPQGRADMALGGSASFASIAASYFSSPQVVGIVGDDFGSHHMDKMSDHGVDVRGIESVAGKTFHWKGRYHENFKDRDTLETALNVFQHFNPSIPEAYRQTKFVLLGNIDPGLQLSVLDQTHDARLVAMDTMNFWINTKRDALLEVIKRVDLLFINDEEAMQLADEWTVLASAGKIRQWGPRYVVIKRGEHGAVLFGPDVTLYVPAVLLTRVVDPTGAGDTFAGGFLGHLSRSGSLDRSNLAAALTWGTVMASYAVEAFSVDGICGLSAHDIEGRRRHLIDLVSY